MVWNVCQGSQEMTCSCLIQNASMQVILTPQMCPRKANCKVLISLKPPSATREHFSLGTAGIRRLAFDMIFHNLHGGTCRWCLHGRLHANAMSHFTKGHTSERMRQYRCSVSLTVSSCCRSSMQAHRLTSSMMSRLGCPGPASPRTICAATSRCCRALCMLCCCCCC